MFDYFFGASGSVRGFLITLTATAGVLLAAHVSNAQIYQSMQASTQASTPRDQVDPTGLTTSSLWLRLGLGLPGIASASGSSPFSTAVSFGSGSLIPNVPPFDFFSGLPNPYTPPTASGLQVPGVTPGVHVGADDPEQYSDVSYDDYLRQFSEPAGLTNDEYLDAVEETYGVTEDYLRDDYVAGGVLFASSGPIEPSPDLFAFSETFLLSSELLANNIAVVPEPMTAAVLGLGTLLLLRRRPAKPR